MSILGIRVPFRLMLLMIPVTFITVVGLVAVAVLNGWLGLNPIRFSFIVMSCFSIFVAARIKLREKGLVSSFDDDSEAVFFLVPLFWGVFLVATPLRDAFWVLGTITQIIVVLGVAATVWVIYHVVTRVTKALLANNNH